MAYQINSFVKVSFDGGEALGQIFEINEEAASAKVRLMSNQEVEASFDSLDEIDEATYRNSIVELINHLMTLGDFNMSIEEMQNQIEALTAKISDLETSNTSLTEGLAERDTKITDLQSEIASLTEDRDNARAEIENINRERLIDQRVAELQEFEAVSVINEDMDEARKILGAMDESSYQIALKLAQAAMKSTDQTETGLPKTTEQTETNLPKLTDQTVTAEQVVESAEPESDPTLEGDVETSATLASIFAKFVPQKK